VPGSDPPRFEEESYVDRHDDPYGPMNDDMEQIDWRRYRPKVDEQYTAAAATIQTNHTIAEIRAMGLAEKPKLQDMSRSIGLTTTKTKTVRLVEKQVDKTIPELARGLIEKIYPEGKDPPRVVFKFGESIANLNIGLGLPRAVKRPSRLPP
jgi:hypothetical protein